jgi:single-strand DNA-binding protein
MENELMASVNKVILIGNLGRDPELRYTQSGQAVANFSLATNERFGGRDGGEQQERTEWHRIVTWGKTAETCAQYLAKGRNVYIEGRLQTRDWEDRDGNKRQTTEVVAQRVQFLGSPPRGEAGGPSGGPGGDQPAPDAGADSAGSGPSGSGPSGAGSSGSGDDIPF